MQIPAGATAKLGDDDVAVAEKVHVKINVGARLRFICYQSQLVEWEDENKDFGEEQERGW